MSNQQRVIENLNGALHRLLLEREDLFLIGEDLVDPYGGAFKATAGLSRTFPERVISMPISEAAIVGMASGLALTGNASIAEIMFSDFTTLAFDQIVNFASKSVTMYGSKVRIPMVIRCPSGGGRGYGPTHSQSLVKHFIGVPNLALFELSPFHDIYKLYSIMLALAQPCLIFEDKILYSRPMLAEGFIDEIFSWRMVGPSSGIAIVDIGNGNETPECIVITTGGVAQKALDAMRQVFLSREIVCRLIVPACLYPFDLPSIMELLPPGVPIVVAEEGCSGGTWGTEVAQSIHSRMWRDLPKPIRLVNSRNSVIPAAIHLEERVLIQMQWIASAIREVIHDRDHNAEIQYER